MAYVDKAQVNKKQIFTRGEFQIQSGGESTFQFVDNRPEAVAQQKLQEMANNSPQTKQTAQFKVATVNPSTQPIQKMAIEEEELLQGRFQPIQKKENNTGLPDNLKSGMENLSGMSLDDVQVHRNSDKPAQLQAHAYAQGTNIHLGPGQEKHLPHEAWHVVQQKQGRVKPTMQMKGEINVNDDYGLEKEADLMGQKALQLKGKEDVSNDSGLEKKADSTRAKTLQKKEKGDRNGKVLDSGIWNTPEEEETANQSNGVAQLLEIEDQANDSQQVTQLMDLQETINEPQAQQDPIQMKENNTGLPDNLKSGVENLSGHSMDDVKVHHNSDKPAQLQAVAYAQGTDIHLGPGQEKHLPHEAWHVAQQKQGRVEPTTQLKGNVNVNDDAGLEKEADVMGAKAASLVQRKSANQESPYQLKSSNDTVVQCLGDDDRRLGVQGVDVDARKPSPVGQSGINAQPSLTKTPRVKPNAIGSDGKIVGSAVDNMENDTAERKLSSGKVEILHGDEQARKWMLMSHAEIKQALLTPETLNFLTDNKSPIKNTLEFLQGSAGLLKSANVDRLVDLFIQGVDCQLLKLGDVQSFATDMKKLEDEKGKVSKENKENYTKLDKARQQLKNDNPPFDALAKEFATCLELGEGKALALWSGGKALSDYANKRQWQPLEQTGLGMIFNDKELTGWSNYKHLITPLWNAISREFCSQKLNKPVHVMIRTFEGDSVLHREELPALRKQGVKVYFHPVWGVGNDQNTYAEVNAEARPDPNITGVEDGGQDSEGAATNLIMKAFTYIANAIIMYKTSEIKQMPLNTYLPEQIDAAEEQSGKYGTKKVEEELQKMTAEQMLKFDVHLQEQWVKATEKGEELEKLKRNKLAK